MIFKIKLTFIAILFMNISMFAQDKYNISGTVVSDVDNLGLPGVNVTIAGADYGTITDLDGKYSLDVSNGDQLVFSFIGFMEQSFLMTGQNILDISLAEDAVRLDEMVVIGYGSTKKSHLTGAVSKVVNKDLDQIAAARVDDALVGKVSGVNIQATEGEAGSAPTSVLEVLVLW